MSHDPSEIINKVKKNSIYLKKRNFVLQYAMLFKGLGSVIFSYFFFFKEINTFIQEGCVKWINVIVKTYIVRKDFYFEQILFFLTLIKESKKKVSHVPKKIWSSTTVSTLIINQHIRMISEGSCDALNIQRFITEINSILKYIKIGNQY